MRSRGMALCLGVLMLAGCGGEAAQPPTQPVARQVEPTPTQAPPVSASPSARPGSVPAGKIPKVVDHGPRTGNLVALTFDADMTDSMLASLRSGKVKSYANLAVIDTLQRRGVPATFFVTGMWAERYPEMMAAIAADPGFEIGNHSYRHSAYVPNCHSLPQLRRTELTQDARQTFDVLEPFGGNQTRFFRFPGLCHDKAALTALAPLGVTVVDGDVVSGDPFATAARPIVERVLGAVKPGSIIIMHVTEANAPYTDEALGPILDGLAAKGLRPVRLSELLG